MTDQDLFSRAMLAYDNEGRHSEGIRAVVALVRAATKAEIEADVERYPLMQRVREQEELRRLADEDARSWCTRYGLTRDETLHVRSALQAALARIDELDAKRSNRPAETPSFDPRTVSVTSAMGTDLLLARCLLDCDWHMSFSAGAQFLATIDDTCAAHPCSGRPVSP